MFESVSRASMGTIAMWFNLWSIFDWRKIRR